MLSPLPPDGGHRGGSTSAGYVLEIVEGPEPGRTVRLGGAPVELGRGEEAGVQLLEDELVSRRHLRLTAGEDDVLVEDLGSRNGTFLNGDELHGPGRLEPGGQLLVGVTLFQPHAGAGASTTAVRQIPSGLTGLRPVPARPLASEPRAPDHVPADVGSAPRRTPLDALLEVHTKSQARRAPLAIFVLVALVVIAALSLR
jgi:pSer/pThr/pTyr-binding forkhead associated (FHA) protein